jgi:DNA replication and repair protein RecF
MSLIRLRAEHVRCLERVELEPTDSNLIFGENASGKTSLLEAIFILGRGRSFRGPGRSAVIRDGQEILTVSGRIRRSSRDVPVGISIGRDQPPEIRIDGESAEGLAALAEWVPVQIIDPAIHNLVEEGPGVRRRFMDWGLFHVEHRFLDVWRRYHRCMRQRNAALRGAAGQLTAWEEQLAEAAEELAMMRDRYLERLRPHVEAVGERLLDGRPTMEHRRGWPVTRSFSEALESSRDRDMRHGITHIGPHRSDITLGLDEKTARGRVSRGQQKLLAATLILGQLMHLIDDVSLRPILLLDDLPAELDKDSLTRVLDVIRTLEAQVFVTALDPGSLDLPGQASVFHVEQGKVRAVV